MTQRQYTCRWLPSQQHLLYEQFKLSFQIRSNWNFILAWCSYIGKRLRKTWRLNYICCSAFLLTTIYVIVGLNEIPVIDLHMLAERIVTNIKPRSNIQFPASIQQLSFVYISSSMRMHPDFKIFLEKFNNQPFGLLFFLLHNKIPQRHCTVFLFLFIVVSRWSSHRVTCLIVHSLPLIILQHGFDATITWLTLLSRLLQTMKSKRMSLYPSIYSLKCVTSFNFSSYKANPPPPPIIVRKPNVGHALSTRDFKLTYFQNSQMYVQEEILV